MCRIGSNHSGLIHAFSSPNAEEALSLLGLTVSVTKEVVEKTASTFSEGHRVVVVIRCGALGAYGMRSGEKGSWVEAYWKDNTEGRMADVLLENEPRTHVVDVTGKWSSCPRRRYDDDGALPCLTQVQETRFSGGYPQAYTLVKEMFIKVRGIIP